MRTVYLSGPMTGIENYNFDEFNRVAKLLQDKGYNVLNPADHGCSPDYTWSDYMKMDIKDLIKCDAVATLPGWQNSRGAKLEIHIAQELGMLVFDYTSFLDDKLKHIVIGD